MAAITAPLLLLFPLLLQLASSADPITNYCGGKTFSSGDPLQSNINLLLSDLIKTTARQGFSISFHGSGPATVYGLTRCRGDVPADVCSACIAAAAEQLPSLCPHRTDARIWYDYCFLRYDTDSFIGNPDTGYNLILFNVENVTDPDRFDGAVKEVMAGVEAAAARSVGLFGRATRKFTEGVTIWGMAQCTRDLTAVSCGECLEAALGLLPEYCSHRQGCQVLYSSCVVRYEIYDFFFNRKVGAGKSNGVS